MRLDHDYAVVSGIMNRVIGTSTLDFSVSTSMRNEPFFN